MNDEEVSFKIVRLYFEEVARLGFKRQLDLDQIINSYFYTLKKIKDKDAVMRRIVREIEAAERAEKKETVQTRTVTTTATTTVPVTKEVTTATTTVPVTKEVTTTTFTQGKPRTKSITDIIEEK